MKNVLTLAILCQVQALILALPASVTTTSSVDISASNLANLRAAMTAGARLNSGDIREKLIARVESGERDGYFEARSTKVSASGSNRLAITSDQRSSSSSDRNRIDFAFTTEGIPRWSLRYRERQNSSTSKFAVKLGLLRLAEVNSTTNAWNSSNSLDLFRKGLNNEWSAIQEETKTTSTGAMVITATTSLVFTEDEKYGNLNVTLQSYFTNEIALNEQGQALTPAGVKYSVFVRDFPFEQTGSNLALVHVLWDKDSNIRSPSSDGANLVAANGNAQFAWDSEVKVSPNENAKVEVGAVVEANADAQTTIENEGNDSQDDVNSGARVMVFEFPQTSELVWDPYLAADQSSAGGRLAAGFGVVAMVASATMMMLV